MSIKIVPLTKGDIPGAVECIQQAFGDDPYYRWVFNDPSKFNKRRNISSLTARCLWGINNALFFVAKETDETSSDASTASSKVVGVSCWLPPHPPSIPESWHSCFQSWVLSFRQLLNNIWFQGRGGLNAKRYWIWKDCQQEAQNAIWTDPRGYYFCNIIAVSPDAQGKGVGRKLFEIVTDRADQEGVKCYLESSKGVPNVEIYQKMGFELVRKMECKDEGDVCQLFCMVREPKIKL